MLTLAFALVLAQAEKSDGFGASETPPPRAELFTPECERLLALVRRDPMNRYRERSEPGLSAEQVKARAVARDEDLRAMLIQTHLDAQLRRSRQISRRLLEPTDDPSLQFYDVVFIGAGSAELTAQLTLRRLGLKFKTLTIERDDVVAPTFFSTRYFYLNSTDGPSDSDERPLPNRGLNLNKIPGGLVNTSNIQASKYATAGDLGDIINLNRAAVHHPILFGQTKKSYRPTPKALRDRGYPNSTIELASGARVYANFVFEATGGGIERSSATSPEGRRSIEDEWDKYRATGELPRHVTGSRMFNYLVRSPNPYRDLSGKRIIVIGDGAYAYVVLEYLERRGPEAGYKEDNAETGRYSEALWLAPGISATCDAFVANSRGRYLLGIPTALQKNRIIPFDGRSYDVRPSPSGTMLVDYIGPDQKMRQLEGDVVVEVIGSKLTREESGVARDVIAELPVTGAAVCGREVYPGAYQIGVASGAPVTAEELANNDDNRASLYLNLVRVEKLIEKVFADVKTRKPSAYPPLVVGEQTAAGFADEATAELWTLVTPNAFVQNRDYALPFLKTTMRSALDDLRFEKAPAKGLIRAYTWARDSRVLIVLGAGEVGGRFLDASVLTRLSEALTASPTFASVIGSYAPSSLALRFEFHFEIDANGRPNVTDVSTEVTNQPLITITRRLTLSGAARANPLSFRDEAPVRTAPQTSPLPDLATTPFGDGGILRAPRNEPTNSPSGGTKIYY